VPLVVLTDRISSRDRDRFDVTRKSGGPAGHPFAPSWPLLSWGLAEMRAGRGDAAWPVYRDRYVEEMRVSWRRHRAAWDALLARERVVLVCYCVEETRCHRTVLAELLVRCR
jgi:uncharacterized protein YeaO (DUF488 family)